MSVLQLAFTGLVMAALPDEFWRVLAQARLGVVLRINAWGWFPPSIFWPAFHWPSALWGLLTPLPGGLLWVCSPYRTKSILPPVLWHGTNL